VHRERGDAETEENIATLDEMALFCIKQIKSMGTKEALAAGLMKEVNGFSEITAENVYNALMGLRSKLIEDLANRRPCTLVEHGSNDRAELCFGEARSCVGSRGNTAERLMIGIATVCEKRLGYMEDMLARNFIRGSKLRRSHRNNACGRFAFVPKNCNVSSLCVEEEEDVDKDGEVLDNVPQVVVVRAKPIQCDPNTRGARSVVHKTGHPLDVRTQKII
jgi:hypothetical protein